MIGLAALGLMAALADGPVSIVPPITKVEARSLSPEQVKKRLLAQFGELLVVNAPQATHGHPTRPLTDFFMQTRWHSTWMPDLCAQDQVIFDFDPVAEESGASTPVRVSGLRTSTHYHLRTVPRSPEPDALSAGERLDQQSRCSALDPIGTVSFSAREESNIHLAAWLMHRVADAAHGEGELPFALNCETYPLGGFESCRKNLAIWASMPIGDINWCDGQPDGGQCLAIWTGDKAFTIKFTPDKRRKVQSVDVGDLVVLADRKAD